MVVECLYSSPWITYKGQTDTDMKKNGRTDGWTEVKTDKLNETFVSLWWLDEFYYAFLCLTKS